MPHFVNQWFKGYGPYTYVLSTRVLEIGHFCIRHQPPLYHLLPYNLIENIYTINVEE